MASPLRPRSLRGRGKVARLLACCLPPQRGHGADSCLWTHSHRQGPASGVCCRRPSDARSIVVVRRQPRRRRPGPGAAGFLRTDRRQRSRLRRLPAHARRAALPESFSASGNSGRTCRRACGRLRPEPFRSWCPRSAPPRFVCAPPSTMPTWRGSCAAARRSTSSRCSPTSTPSAITPPMWSKCPASMPCAAAFSMCTRPKPTARCASSSSAMKSSRSASSIRRPSVLRTRWMKRCCFR